MNLEQHHQRNFPLTRAGKPLAPLLLGAALFFAGCSGEETNPNSGVGGAGTGGSGIGGTGAGAGGVSSGGAPGTGGLGEGGAPASGGAGGSGSEKACSFRCVAQCVQWGGTEQVGTCEGTKVCCDSETIPVENPLAHLVPEAEKIGLLLARRFEDQTLRYSSVKSLPGDAYKDACEWYGAFGVAQLTKSQDLLSALVTKFDPLKDTFVKDMVSGAEHVDRYVYGIVPLEIYLQTGDDSYVSPGALVADVQQATNQTRNAIDDMFMMTSLQLQAYRATGESTYIDFMSDTMLHYLEAQQPNGLFFHNVDKAPVYWGRGNGWFAAGMAEMLRDLPMDHENYGTILAGYKKMMEGLLPLQSENGLWYQVLDMPTTPDNWEETSSTAMFTYAMTAGVRRGILDATTYVPVIEAAWAGLQTKINDQGAISAICQGTWYHPTPEDYMALNRLTGDGHGQAPVLWIAREILR